MKRLLRAATVLDSDEADAVSARARSLGTSASEMARDLMLRGAVPRQRSAPVVGRRIDMRIWCSPEEYRRISRHAIALRYPSLAGAIRDVLLFGEVPQ